MVHVAESSGGHTDTEFTRDYTSEFTTTQRFDNKEELVMWAKKVGRSNIITVVVLRSDSGNGKGKAGVTLGCEKSGKCDPRNVRPTGTKKCDCPFRLKGEKVAAGDVWQLKVVNGKHNHEVKDTTKEKEGHSFEGKLFQEEKSLVKDLLKKGKKPKEVLEALRENDDDNKSTGRTIYNESRRLQRDKWLEYTSSLLLESMSKAEEYNFIMKQRVGPKERILDFFITHPSGLELFLAFPTDLNIELQYSPSGWARLTVLGVTSTQTSFFVAWALLSQGDRKRWRWALSSLHGLMDEKGIVIPQIVIVDIAETDNIKILRAAMTAINDVLGAAKVLISPFMVDQIITKYRPCTISNFEEIDGLMKKMGELAEQSTEADFEHHLRQLLAIDPYAFCYLTRTLLPYKEMFVAAWTNKIMHFGSTNDCWFVYANLRLLYSPFTDPGSSRKELGCSEVQNFLKKLHYEIEDEKTEIKYMLEQSLKNDYKDGLRELKGLYGTISVPALRLIRKQHTLAREKKYTEKCSCTIRSTHGLPCAHEINKYIREDRPLPLECIHPYWRKLDLEPLRRTGEANVDRRIKRPKLSEVMDTSTPYAPLLPTIAESEHSSHSAGPSILPSIQDITQSDDPDLEVYNIQQTKQLKVIEVCPPVLESYILDIVDVPRDGHCGFRVIASLLGIVDDHGQPGWMKVREDLQKELNSKSDQYSNLFGSKQEVDLLLNRLNYLLETCAEKDYWMMMPEIGHVVASCYCVVLMYLSSVQNQCFTFFPLQNRPVPMSVPLEIAIGYCDEHFVQVHFKGDHMFTHPMPPAAPLLTKKEPSVFDIQQQQCSQKWAARYSARIQKFSASLRPIVSSHENPVVLDAEYF